MMVTHREFANVNGIEYNLDQLLGVSPSCAPGDMTPITAGFLPVTRFDETEL